VKYLLILLFLVSCNDIVRTPVDGGDFINADSGDADSGKDETAECDGGSARLLSCTEPFVYCGVRKNKCGSVDCGTCESPWICGAQDLQDYMPYPDMCGLGCDVTAAPSPHCPGRYPVEHMCISSQELLNMVSTQRFQKRYSCLLNLEISDKELMMFCCSL